jgi:hypothetical protein
MPPPRCTLYARASTADQHCENQLTELRAYRAACGWIITREYIDQGVSGAKERRSGLDELVRRNAPVASTCWAAGDSADWDATCAS